MKESKSLKLSSVSFTLINNHLSKKTQNIYFLNSLKNFKIKKENYKSNLTSKEKVNNKNLKTKSIAILNMSNQKTLDAKRTGKKKKNLKIISNYYFKNLYEIIKKNNLKKSASYNNINTIDKEKIDFESNFMKLRKEANNYTSNVNYIKNSKMMLLDKYIYDNNRYKPDRLGLFNMSDFKTMQLKNRKTINEHIYFNHNKYQRNFDSNSKY